MTPWSWIKTKLQHQPDPETMEIVAAIEHETVKLNGALVDLEKTVGEVQIVRHESRNYMEQLLDEALEVRKRESR